MKNNTIVLSLTIDKTPGSEFVVAIIQASAARKDSTWSDDSVGGRRYKDLTLRGQYDGTNGWYGWEVEYHRPYSVRLHEAEAMVKMLRLIRKRYNQYSEDFGYAKTTEDHVKRFAKAVGCQRFRIQDNGYNCDKHGWSEYNATEGTDRAVNLLAQEVTAVKPERTGTLIDNADAALGPS